MLIRKGAQDLGFNCDHSVVGLAKNTGQPFCQRCQTRLITVKPPSYFKNKLTRPGEYWVVETFLDKFYKEQRAKEKAWTQANKGVASEVQELSLWIRRLEFLNLEVRESKFEHENFSHYILYILYYILWEERKKRSSSSDQIPSPRSGGSLLI